MRRSAWHNILLVEPFLSTAFPDHIWDHWYILRWHACEQHTIPHQIFSIILHKNITEISCLGRVTARGGIHHFCIKKMVFTEPQQNCREHLTDIWWCFQTDPISQSCIYFWETNIGIKSSTRKQTDIYRQWNKNLSLNYLSEVRYISLISIISSLWQMSAMMSLGSIITQISAMWNKTDNQRYWLIKPGCKLCQLPYDI